MSRGENVPYLGIRFGNVDILAAVDGNRCSVCLYQGMDSEASL
jgi:hypothetical protein